MQTWEYTMDGCALSGMVVGSDPEGAEQSA